MSKMDYDLNDSELETDFELENDGELEEHLELELEGIDEREFEDQEDSELEEENDFELEAESEENESDLINRYAERLYELSTRSYENEYEVDQEVDRILNEMERDFFFKGLGRRLKRAGKGLLKKGWRMMKSKGLSFIKGNPLFQAAKGVTSLARGNLKGFLGTLAKTGLKGVLSAIPGGSVALPVLKGLGFEHAGDAQNQKEAWRNYVHLTREAYNNLAQELNEEADNYEVAPKIALAAFNKAVKNMASPVRGIETGIKGEKKMRRISLRKGQKIVIRSI
ncbi:MAG: hypothetical protein HY960_06480 [Ignavibacteriae bacterium]|nr:hypothetical protein [Ignavibacteriota bacterium]